MSFDDWDDERPDLVTATLEAIGEINQRNGNFEQALLNAFLRAAWPSQDAQDQ